MSLTSRLETVIEGAPEGTHLAPRSPEDVASILQHASATGTPVRVWGGGTHQKMGRAPGRGIVMSTASLDRVEAWEPDDLTIVAGAGARVSEMEELISTRNQSAILPEMPGRSTVGGVIATGRSSLRRWRLLGTRERVLEVTAVTGDGRIIRSGGRVVKNVSGYDLHRSMVGAFGSLGVIVSVCLKLWPVPPAGATIKLRDLGSVSAIVRPLALLETREDIELFVWGTPAEVDSTVARTGGTARPGLHWPSDPAGQYRWSLRVPPASMGEAIARAGPWNYLAIHGTGEIRMGSSTPDGARSLREWAESLGGSLVLVDHPGSEAPIEPWGKAPETADLQRRLIAEFDPERIINPNRLPGGL